MRIADTVLPGTEADSRREPATPPSPPTDVIPARWPLPRGADSRFVVVHCSAPFAGLPALGAGVRRRRG